MKEVISFIEEKEGVYKATTKDMWTMMLEFCETVKPDLQDYEADSVCKLFVNTFFCITDFFFILAGLADPLG
ncbi:hypothetical protein BT96DRAFT_922564 [Gymnopus androsaceus JB14]|uniref:DCUN1 domain-containing protein n=1 Tax=Gymnopus androsaceus JB14 TaxID=1447944 RepID=A0A6A4HFC5_9AGAR|nr:hypothetical protein BT96DRAFT_922564 [Gymnopus androsaceus JB14]